jgi:23S rRNA (guanine745-N1)-methyltransferase
VSTADAWAPLPVADACVEVVLSVFSPRNAAEFARSLRPGGSVITVTPEPDHLIELRSALGLLGVEGDKRGRLADTFGRAGLTMIDQRLVSRRDPWPLDDALRAILMGPNAFHTKPDEVRRTAERLAWPRPVTTACMITRWSR